MGNWSQLHDQSPPLMNETVLHNGTVCYGTNDCARLQQIMVTTVDGFIFIAGMSSHALVMRILLERRQHRRRHGTTILLLNLSASDMLQLTCLPFNVSAFVLQAWIFGDFLCKLVSFIGVACSCASVFTLVALAINRYINILYPSKVYRFQRDWYIAVLGAIWLPSLGLATPEFIYRTMAPEGPYCFAFLTADFEATYCTALFLCAFATPLTTIVIMYAKILNYLRVHRLNLRTHSMDTYNTQVTMVSILLVGAFGACWLPSYILMFLLVQWRTRLPGAFPTVAWVLASSSTIVNPFIYLFTSRQFRKDLQALFARRSWRRWHIKIYPANLGANPPVTEQSQAISMQISQATSPPRGDH